MFDEGELGLCVCIAEPRGDFSLEGYQRGESYVYRFIRSIDGSSDSYYRMFPVFGASYYETCSITAFNKHFKKEIKQ
ncbi:hypothetical protein JCM19235_1328 [Vibrio maritimus]|uniref:Uncharacterized protein n=1 Tax=Vibrio maritimus TaxID=990268 RepID=A0A090SUN6_9VIBR|nr:hypothetical protein JCM19235_1328 [Vibrio maritimus]